MKRTLSIMLTLLILLALFAGCTKNEEKEGAATPSPSPSQTTAQTEEQNKKDESKFSSYEGTSIVAVDKETVHPSDTAVLKFAGKAEPSSICYLTSNGSTGAFVTVSVFYDTLVVYDVNNNTVLPSLAKSWEWVDDYTLRFKLRDDVYSHMGDHFTASDVIFSVESGCANKKLATTYGSSYDLSKCKVVDDYTVDLGFQTINPFILFDLSKISQPIVVEESVKKLGGLEKAGDNPLMATGPYKFTKWDSTSLVLYGERNEDYWGTLPYYKYYEGYIISDNTARCMGVEAGDYLSCQGPTSNAVINAVGNKNLTTYITSGTNLTRWDLNSDREPLNVKEVRQALALAVNYEAIVQVAYNGYSDEVDSVIPVANFWHASPKEGEKEYYYYHDIERAKEKLVEAGYADGFKIGIMFTSGQAEITATVEILQNCLRDINVSLDVQQYENATYTDKKNNADFDTIISGTLNSTPASTIKQMDPRINTYTGFGWIQGHEDEIYGLMEKCRNTADMDKCLAYLADFQDLIREYCPSIPVANSKNFNMTSSEIVNVTLDASGFIMPASFYPAEYLG